MRKELISWRIMRLGSYLLCNEAKSRATLLVAAPHIQGRSDCAPKVELCRGEQFQVRCRGCGYG